MLIDHNASLIIEAPIAVGGSGHWLEILAGEEKEELYVVVALSVNCTAAAVQGLVAATVHDGARRLCLPPFLSGSTSQPLLYNCSKINGNVLFICYLPFD